MGVLLFFPPMGLRIDAVDSNEKLSPWLYENRQQHQIANFK